MRFYGEYLALGPLLTENLRPEKLISGKMGEMQVP